MKYLNIIPNVSENIIIRAEYKFTDDEYKVFISGILSGQIKIDSEVISNNSDILNILGYWDGFENPYIIGDNIIDIVDDRFGARDYLLFSDAKYYVNKYWTDIEKFIYE